MSRCVAAVLAIGVAYGLTAGGAAAQEENANNFNVPRFAPAPAGDAFFGAPSATTPGHLKLRAMLLGDYAHKPAVIRNAGGDEVAIIVENQMLLHFNVSGAFWERFHLNLDFPIAFQSGDGLNLDDQTLPAPEGVAAGDIRVGLRGRIFGDDEGIFVLGLGGYLWVPTNGDYVSNGSVRGWPFIVGNGTIGRFIYAGAIGPELGESKTVVNTPQGNRFSYGVGAGMLLGMEKQAQVGLEANGSLTLEDVQKRTTNVELLGGFKYRFLGDFVAGVGAGPGLSGGLGTPVARAVFSFAWSPDKKDSDKDGILDGDDACPLKAGKPSQDPKKHGCPDSDGDGVIDKEDACPQTPGVATQDPKTNGCPPAAAPGDRDGDGIVDDKDACPDVAGKADPDPAKNGCPDSDGDGIFDKVDACPQVAGVADPDPKKNGCPKSDKDGDGVVDDQDACVDIPGIKTSDPKTNGCPGDTDGDGFRDDQDGCPKEPGPDNADPEKRGCPIVAILDKDLSKVEFDTNKATIRPESGKILDQIAQTLKEHPELVKLEVQGHTDNVGTPQSNKILSQARADSVRAALVKRGIPMARLTAKGYGQEVPIADNTTDEGRQRNRRVQFKILKQK